MVVLLAPITARIGTLAAVARLLMSIAVLLWVVACVCLWLAWHGGVGWLVGYLVAQGAAIFVSARAREPASSVFPERVTPVRWKHLGPLLALFAATFAVILLVVDGPTARWLFIAWWIAFAASLWALGRWTQRA